MKRTRTTKPRIPIVLPLVEIRIDDTGTVAVTIDREPYETPATLRRDGVRRLVQDLADRHGPIRVEITEADGQTYVDIETPAAEDPSADTPSTATSAERARTFAAGEEVLVVVVVSRLTANSDGHVALQLPPALLQRHGASIRLIGQTSGAATPLIAGGGS